jgi:hypothetical protein
LDQLLAIYGGIKLKSFQDRVRHYRQKLTPRDELVELVARLADKHINTVLAVARSLNFGVE